MVRRAAWRAAAAAALLPFVLLGAEGDGGKEVYLAVIVHPKNPVTDLKLGELQSLFKLERQFWPNDTRVTLYLPPSQSVERKVLLQRVYRMDNPALQKYWLGKIFAGDIPAMPSVARSAKVAADVVKKTEGAVSVVLAGEVPPGVRVLLVDGKGPKDKDYALIARPSEEATTIP